MADAKKTSRIETTYTVTLTEREAAVLQRVFQVIGGCPEKTGRGAIQSISNALYTAGARPAEDCEFNHNNGLRATLYFRS